MSDECALSLANRSEGNARKPTAIITSQGKDNSMICRRYSFRLACAGLVSLGWMLHSTSTTHAEAVATFTGLGDLPGGSFISLANGVSADGSVVVGRGASASGNEASRWTSGTGMVGLGDLPGGAS
jgi:probable HAF family extracellular repeat protein